MAKKSSPPTEKSKNQDKSTAETAHYNAIMIEDLKSEFKMVIEHTNCLKDELIQRMDEKFSQQDERLDGLETILKYNTELLRRLADKVEKHDHEIENLKTATLS